MSSETTTLPFKDTLQVALTFLEGLDCPRALSVYILANEYLLDNYEPGEFDRLVKGLGMSVTWFDHRDPKSFSLFYQASTLLSKLPPKSNTDLTLSTTAIDGFFKAEQQNARINEEWALTDFNIASKRLRSIGTSIENIRNRMRSVLGRAPSLQSLNDRGTWTSGASVNLSRRLSSGESKSEFGTSVTYQLATALQQDGVNLSPLINTRNAWSLVPGNLVRTVPKNITTDRTIAMEPEINAFFQRALGDHIRKRLLLNGINLNDQSLNQRACARAGKDLLATIDIRNASNSVLLFPALSSVPDDWARLLEVTRSPYGTLNSRKDVNNRKASWFEYNMLSSMGNGFTFEFESALFYVLALESGAEDWEINVYGDDIILPQRCVSRLCALLSIYGFEVNMEKSFTSGTFFESCGVYVYNGVDVTPLKIKALLNDAKDTIILANKLRIYAHSLNYHSNCDKRVLPAWRMCLSRLPRAIRTACRGPLGSGLCLFVNRNEAIVDPLRKYSRKSVNYHRLRAHQLVPQFKTVEDTHLGVYYFRLYQVSLPTLPMMSYGNIVKLETVSYSLKPMWLEGSWYDFGYWE